MAKKILIVLGVIIGLLVVALALVPVFYDVNAKLKPLIIQTAEENLNAKVELGQLSLSAWGKIRVTIESLKITETLGGTKVFEVTDSDLTIPLTSLLAGQINVTLHAKAPKINLISGSDGKLNALKLIRAGPTSSNEAGAATSGGSSASGALGNRFLLSLDIKEAEISYANRSGVNSRVTGLDLEAENVGLNRPFKLAGQAKVDFKSGEAAISGPVGVTGETEIRMSPQGFEALNLKSNLDLNDLSIVYGGLFRKSPKNPLNLVADISARPSEIEIRALDLVVNDLKINATGKVTTDPALAFDLRLKSNQLKLEHWQNIIALVKDFELRGEANFDLALKGSFENLQYHGGLDLAHGSAKIPGLVVPATDMNLDLNLSTDQVKIARANMKLGASDLSLTGSVENFSAPKMRMAAKSNLLNFDELLPQAPASAETKAESANAETSTETSFEGPIARMKKNPILRKLDFAGITNFKKLVMRKAELTDFNSEAEFKSLVLNLKKAELRAFSGRGTASVVTDFNAKDPSYKIQGQVDSMDVNAAISNQFPDLKDSLKGLLSGKMNISGSGSKLSEVKRNLVGSGDVQIDKGSWSALAGLKMLAEKLSSIPGAKDKVAGVVIADRFKTAKSKFTIREGKIFLENAEADMEGSKTTLYPTGWVSFEKTLDIQGQILAPVQNPPADLRAGDGRAKIPFPHLTGSVTGPNADFDPTLKALAQAYVKDEGAKAVSQGLQKLKENVKDENVKKILEGVDEQKVKDLLKGIKF